MHCTRRRIHRQWRPRNLSRPHNRMGYSCASLPMVCLEQLREIKLANGDARRCISGQFIRRLPLQVTVLPIALPTLYLWIVDTLALGRGTWVIETGTKMSISLWYRLDIE